MHIIAGIITALILFAVLVIVHESGHFLTAKAVGIRVNEFSVGMGPLIWKKETEETTYSIRALPIGGYVAMEGESDESDDERAFNNKPAWARALVVTAGPLMNFLLAVLVIGGMITWSGTSVEPYVAEAPEGMPAYAAGILQGDRIVSVDGTEISDGEEISKAISEIPADAESVSLGVERGGTTQIIDIPLQETEDGSRIIGIRFEVGHNLLKGILQGFRGSVEMERLMIAALGDILTGNADQGDVVGPIGVVSIVDQTVQTGFLNVLYLLALLSLNLALVNILPFPALDGGRLLFIVIRTVTGKAISDETEAKIHFLGMFVLFSLMIFITLKDFNVFILGNG